jgi:AAHS family 4-hydroxybenzoate transporter-like MFS transporter
VNASTPTRVAWMCAIVLLCEGYDIAAVGYAIPSLVDAWRVPAQAFTISLVAGNAGIVLGALAAGLLGDRLGRKPILAASVLLFGSFSLASAFAVSPASLAALRLMTGLGLGGGIPIAVALASDVAPQSFKGRLVTGIFLGVPIGFAVGGLVAGQVVRIFGWPAIFAIGGAAPILFAPLLMLYLPESSAVLVRASPSNRVAALYGNGLAAKTLLVWCINFFSALTTYYVLLWAPAVLHGAGATPVEAAFATSIYALGHVAGILLIAALADGLGMERVLTFALALEALSLLAIGFFGTHSLLLPAMMFAVGVGGGSQAGVNALSGLIYPFDIRATGAGWAFGLGRVGAIVGPLLGGLILAHGLEGRHVLAIAAIPAFGAMTLMAVLARVGRARCPAF